MALEKTFRRKTKATRVQSLGSTERRGPPCMLWKSSIGSRVVSRCSSSDASSVTQKQNLVIINTSDRQAFSNPLQLCAKVECKFHGRVGPLSVFIWLSECSCDRAQLRVCQQLTSQIRGIMFSDTDCDLIATLAFHNAVCRFEGGLRHLEVTHHRCFISVMAPPSTY